MAMKLPLADLLSRYTREGELYEKLAGDRVRCFACGHRCLIPPGHDGVCRVRFNEGGVLKVPFGYVGALQVDPVEKKPFFHALPGSRALSFGMLGCDFHCGYCFTGDTVVVTERGPITFRDLFEGCARRETRPDAELAYPEDRHAVTASGALRRIKGVVRHRYQGEMVTLTPRYLPPLRCTPDHRVYTTASARVPPQLRPASQVTTGDYLAIPARSAAAASRFSPGIASHVSRSRVRIALEESIEPAAGVIVTARYWLVPVQQTAAVAFDGDVYNMEVEDEHSYLAGFFAVANCQNWVTSQALRDPNAVSAPDVVTPAELVQLAKKHHARIVTSTYNEPLITSEWAVAVFREARKAGLVCSYVSNGNGTPEVLDYIRPWVSLYKVDLKSFRDRPYRDLGGTLERVLWTIRALHEQHFWLEIVTLVVPGFNDSDAELRDIAQFLAGISPDIPWHVTAFHQDYKMTAPENTGVARLLRASEIGREAGLHFVYAGNIPGRVEGLENTYCPGCGTIVVERYGFRVLRNDLVGDACPKCARVIPGVWTAEAAEQLHAQHASGP